MTTITETHGREAGMTSEQRLVIFASSLGTIFEWYDFYIYGTLGAFLAKYFFSNVPANIGFIFALLAFAAGFAVRPFGALIFGRLGVPDPHPLQRVVAAVSYWQRLVRRLPAGDRLCHRGGDRKYLLRPLVPDSDRRDELRRRVDLPARDQGSRHYFNVTKR